MSELAEKNHERGPLEVWRIHWRDAFGAEMETWSTADGKYLDGDPRPGVDFNIPVHRKDEK